MFLAHHMPWTEWTILIGCLVLFVLLFALIVQPGKSREPRRTQYKLFKD